MYDLAAPEHVSGAAEVWVLVGYVAVFAVAVAVALVCRWVGNRRRVVHVRLPVPRDRYGEALRAARDRLAEMTERERL